MANPDSVFDRVPRPNKLNSYIVQKPNMYTRRHIDRRTVLKTLGGGAIGSVALAGTVSAGDTGDNRRQDSFTWANDTLWEMLESDPHPPDKDSEGDEEAHRPLWLVAPQDTAGHSPHVIVPEGPLQGTPADHVIGLDPGKKFYSAQWHVHVVFESPGILATTGAAGADLTSEAAISAAADAGLVSVVETPTVFTCPVRPHTH